MKKCRADLLLVERGLTPTRTKAQAVIMAGLVYSGKRRIDKAGQTLSDDAPLKVVGKACPFVSRGGLKLQAALDGFGLPVEGEVCADIGSSTGGFTDCLLQRGARRVFAVDVGHGQFDSGLKSNPRVVLREKINARNLQEDFFGEAIGLVAIDVSFISLKLILPAIIRSAPRATVLAMVKPQFEAGRERIERGGVIRDPLLRKKIVGEIRAFAEEVGYNCLGTVESPVKCPKGNVETFLHLRPFSRRTAIDE